MKLVSRTGLEMCEGVYRKLGDDLMGTGVVGGSLERSRLHHEEGV